MPWPNNCPGSRLQAPGMAATAARPFQTVSGIFQRPFRTFCLTDRTKTLLLAPLVGMPGTDVISPLKELDMQQRNTQLSLSLIRIVAAVLVGIHGWHRLAGGDVAGL